jgi:hypothetical protein
MPNPVGETQQHPAELFSTSQGSNEVEAAAYELFAGVGAGKGFSSSSRRFIQ